MDKPSVPHWYPLPYLHVIVTCQRLLDDPQRFYAVCLAPTRELCVSWRPFLNGWALIGWFLGDDDQKKVGKTLKNQLWLLVYCTILYYFILYSTILLLILSSSIIVRLSWIMSTPDETKPWFMKKRGGTPPIVISSDTFLWYPPN